jgi:anaerobic magnesium-protoporphyrin IX monomethyl ester cyclase
VEEGEVLLKMREELKDTAIIPKRQKVKLALILATRDLPGYNYFKPLGLGYLKSYLNKELPSLNVDIYEDIGSLIASKPDCVGVSATTEDFAVAKRYIKQVQDELGCPVLIGGVHISLLPETLPKGVIACIGEGEVTLTDLMNLFLERYSFHPTELSKVKGIAYWDENDNLCRTEPRELITPLDILPFPDRDALGIKLNQNQTLYMFSSRGCPYNCKFCVSRVHWKKYREFSSDYVLREIEQLVNRYSVNAISFFDDLFIVNKKRLREIANKFAEMHYNVTTNCAVRANLVDDELCELLKKLNVKEVTFGAESFSEPVLRELKAGSVTVEQNQHAIDTLNKHGIKTNVSIIFDTPGETREDLITSWKALFHNLQLGKINKVGWGFLRPYPGNAYWDIAVKMGITGIDMDWDIFKNWNNFHFNDSMTKNEVNEITTEWETKCYIINLHFRDEALPPYLSKEALFAYRENLIRSICEREPRDETDSFVAQEYEKFLKSINQHKLIPVKGCWASGSGESWRWTTKKAVFSIDSTVRKVSNLLNLVFYVPNINYYGNRELTVTIKAGVHQESITVVKEGEYVLTVPIPFSLGRFFTCEINCSDDFCPAEVSDSKDERKLSLIVSRFELAKDDPLNVIHVMRLTEDGTQ